MHLQTNLKSTNKASAMCRTNEDLFMVALLPAVVSNNPCGPLITAHKKASDMSRQIQATSIIVSVAN